MRDRLKNFDWHIHKIHSGDFEQILNSIRGFEKDRRQRLKIWGFFMRLRHPFRASDIMDDVTYNGNIEAMTLYQFGLIRLFGLFETWLEHHVLPPKKEVFPRSKNPNYTGLHERKGALKQSKYRLICEEELRIWANLRNAVTHSPPGQSGFIDIGLVDLEELKKLLFDVMEDLWKQKESRDNIPRNQGEFELVPRAANQTRNSE